MAWGGGNGGVGGFDETFAAMTLTAAAATTVTAAAAVAPLTAPTGAPKAPPKARRSGLSGWPRVMTPPLVEAGYFARCEMERGGGHDWSDFAKAGGFSTCSAKARCFEAFDTADTFPAPAAAFARRPLTWKAQRAKSVRLNKET